MFVSLFIAGVATGVGGTVGVKKIKQLVSNIKEKDKELKELKEENRGLKNALNRVSD